MGAVILISLLIESAGLVYFMMRIALLLCLMALFTATSASGANSAGLPETTEVPSTGDFVDDVSSMIEIPAGSSFAVGTLLDIGGEGGAGFNASNNNSGDIIELPVISGGNESTSLINSSAFNRPVYDVASYFRVKPTYEVDKYFRIKPIVTVDEWPFVCDIV